MGAGALEVIGRRFEKFSSGHIKCEIYFTHLSGEDE